MRNIFYFGCVICYSVVGALAYFNPVALNLFWILVPLTILGLSDVLQKRQTIRRNFPLIGHFRYLLEEIRPEIQQYFIETNWDGMPFSRDRRSVVYQRAKKDLDTQPFGTQLDVYEPGYEWINHSIKPKPHPDAPSRIKIGGPDCTQPYSSSLLNISAMSYGALSSNAILALNTGAKLGQFAHNTGEGGISPYHLKANGDLIWQIGTGYFGARNPDGTFSIDLFKEKASLPNIKMIEIKLSQGAKPGHGGILPAKKVTPEIAAIRNVELGKDVLSPPWHSAFSTPIEFLEFIQKLRVASKGKPIGFKLCIGKRREFFAICKAMVETKITPDFISIDGAEGGTGAAPPEFSNSVGTPLNDGLIFVHNALVGCGMRDRIKISVAGKITTGFSIASKLALGADLCASARGMMFALGCIQALRCNNNTCPTGVATQKPSLVKGLDPQDKSVRVFNFHRSTIHTFEEVLAAAGLSHPSELKPWHIHRRTSRSEIKHYGELFNYLEPGVLLKSEPPKEYAHAWEHSSSKEF